MENLVNETAAVLRDFSEELAAAWLADPFRRVDLALAFARGFVQDEADDVHPVASVVLRVALADRAARGTN